MLFNRRALSTVHRTNKGHNIKGYNNKGVNTQYSISASVRPIVKQMLVSLDEKVPEDLGVVIPDYFFWFYPPFFTVLKIVLSTYGPVILVVVVVVEKKVLSHPTMGGVILRLGALPEPWESENTSEDLRRS